MIRKHVLSALLASLASLVACSAPPPAKVAPPVPEIAPPPEPEPVCAMPVEGKGKADVERAIRETRRALAAEGACDRAFKLGLLVDGFEYGGGELHARMRAVVQSSKGDLVGQLDAKLTMTAVRAHDASAERDLLKAAAKKIASDFAKSFR